MRVMFTIQGEGRGHMTQALAVRQILSRSGHELVAVVIGRHDNRTVPDYVTRGMGASVELIPSPGFARIAGKRVSMSRSAWRTLAQQRVWRASLTRVREVVDESRPDLLVNFFEPLTGLAQLQNRLPVPVVSIAHQHMIGHPAHRAPRSARLEQRTLSAFAELVGYGSWKLALSFYPAPERKARHEIIAPPILRRELFEVRPTPGDHYLVYIVNPGYDEHIRAWHRSHPAVKLHCFYDRPDAPAAEQVADNLTFHRLSDVEFLRLMASSRGVVTTAGFESVSEAAWLDKSLLVIPVAHHAEQKWNARDAVQAKLARASDSFDLDLLSSLPERRDNAWFRDWVACGEERLSAVIDACLARRQSDRR